jgi:hypothetical protein
VGPGLLKASLSLRSQSVTTSLVTSQDGTRAIEREARMAEALRLTLSSRRLTISLTLVSTYKGVTRITSKKAIRPIAFEAAILISNTQPTPFQNRKKDEAKSSDLPSLFKLNPTSRF